MDESPDISTIQEITYTISGVDGVVNVRDIRVHQRGPDRTADVKIEVDGHITVDDGHEIATKVKTVLIESDLRIVDAMVHVDPVPAEEPAARSTR